MAKIFICSLESECNRVILITLADSEQPVKRTNKESPIHLF